MDGILARIADEPDVIQSFTLEEVEEATAALLEVADAAEGDALDRRLQAAEAAETVASSDGDAGDAAAAGGGEDKTVNGVVVPALLLDRSKRARERLSAA